MAQTANRLLELLALLQARRDWTGSELAGWLEVSTRTIRRDIERLRGLGYPVESLTGPAGRYRWGPGGQLPPLLLDDEEAIAIAVGLATATRAAVTGIEETAVRALVKLEQVLPSHLRRRVAALGAATSTLPGAGPTVDPQDLTAIAAACRDTERLRFAYTGRDGAAGRREVEPHALVNRGRRWYLVAWDLAREDWRPFRLDRLTRPAGTGVRFRERTLPAPDAAAFVDRSIAAAPHRYETNVVLHASAEEVRRRMPRAEVEPLEDGRCRLTASDDELRWLALRLVMLDVDFEIDGPPELREHLRGLSRRLARA